MSDNNSNAQQPIPTGRGSFNKFSPERRREIARKGGLAAQASGVAHRWTSETAREAGKIGGYKVSSNREHMSKIGKLGGLARGKSKRQQATTPTSA